MFFLQVYRALSERLGLNDESMVLNVFVTKMWVRMYVYGVFCAWSSSSHHLSTPDEAWDFVGLLFLGRCGSLIVHVLVFNPLHHTDILQWL